MRNSPCCVPSLVATSVQSFQFSANIIQEAYRNLVLLPRLQPISEAKIYLLKLLHVYYICNWYIGTVRPGHLNAFGRDHQPITVQIEMVLIACIAKCYLYRSVVRVEIVVCNVQEKVVIDRFRHFR